MRIEMEAAPPAPVWPEGITVRTMRPGEEPAVHAALNEAFDDHWGHLPLPYETWKAFFLERSDFDAALCFLAMEGDQIAGFSLCRPEQGMGWVDDLGVRRPWRRYGLALALLLHAFDEFHQRGERTVGLSVDAQSLTGATHLYEKAGMRPFREWEVFEKELRPGIELSTQKLE
jgi:ribosomal protein S18 acetylase RimI-like enzyme